MHKERFKVFAVLSTLAGAMLKTSKGTRYHYLIDMKCYYLILQMIKLKLRDVKYLAQGIQLRRTRTWTLAIANFCTN